MRPLIIEALGEINDLAVHLYEPGHAPLSHEMPVAHSRVKMTTTRAALLLAFENYLERAFVLGRLEAQKLIYFLSEAGQAFPRLQFEKAKFGPYAEVVNHMLTAMDGKLIRGFGDREQHSDITVLRDALAAAHDLAAHDGSVVARVERVLDLIEGYEGLYGLELLASVHWVAKHDLAAASSVEAARAAVQTWNTRKRARFPAEDIDVAWHHLSNRGWLGAGASRRNEAMANQELA